MADYDDDDFEDFDVAPNNDVKQSDIQLPKQDSIDKKDSAKDSLKDSGNGGYQFDFDRSKNPSDMKKSPEPEKPAPAKKDVADSYDDYDDDDDFNTETKPNTTSVNKLSDKFKPSSKHSIPKQSLVQPKQSDKDDDDYGDDFDDYNKDEDPDTKQTARPTLINEKPKPIATSISINNSKPNYFQKKSTKKASNDSIDNGMSDIKESINSKPSVIKMGNSNHSLMVSPKHRKLHNMAGMSTSTARGAKKRNRMNRSMVSSDGMKHYTTRSMNKPKKTATKMNPLLKIEKDLDQARHKIAKSSQLREQSEGVGDEESRLVILNKENIVLRDELKSMNNNLNSFIEVLKEFKNQKNTRQKFLKLKMVPKENKIRAKISEKKTYSQITQNMKQEHDRLKKRLEVVGDPSYALRLRSDIMKIKEDIHELQDEKRKMTNSKFVRERHMNKVIMAGQPEAMDEIQDRVKELTVLFDRNTKLSKKLEFQAKTQEESNTQAQELAEKLKELEQKAESKGIDLDEVYKEDEGGADGVSKSAQVYDRKKAVLQQAIDTNQNMYTKKLEVLHDKLKDLLQSQNDSVASIKIRQSQIVDKRQEVSELMVKSKLVSDEEAQKMNESVVDEPLEDLPQELEVEDDPIVAKLRQIVKNNHPKGRMSSKKPNRYKSSSHSSKKPAQTKIPNTNSSFNTRKKVDVRGSDDDKKSAIKSSVKASHQTITQKSNDSKDMLNPRASKESKHEEDPNRGPSEMSIENTSEQKPLFSNNKPFGGKASKPFGSGLGSKPNFGAKAAASKPF